MSSKLRLAGAAAIAATALAALPAGAGANVQVGSSGWQWGNPLPQGNTLRAMSFAGSTGYAAGDFGTLLHTTDGGATWSGLPAGTFANLTAVQARRRRHRHRGRRLRRAALRRRRRHLLPDRLHAGRVQRAASTLAGLLVHHRAVGYLVLGDGTVVPHDDGGDEFAQKTAVPGTRAAGRQGQARPRCGSSPTPRASPPPATGKIFQTTDCGQHLEGRQRHPARGQRHLVRRRHDGLRGRRRRRCSSRPTTAARPGRPRTSAAPARAPHLDPLRLGDAVRHRHRDGHAARAHRRRRRQLRASLTPSHRPALRGAFAGPTRLVAAGGRGRDGRLRRRRRDLRRRSAAG